MSLAIVFALAAGTVLTCVGGVLASLNEGGDGIGVAMSRMGLVMVVIGVLLNLTCLFIVIAEMPR